MSAQGYQKLARRSLALAEGNLGSIRALESEAASQAVIKARLKRVRAFINQQRIRPERFYQHDFLTPFEYLEATKNSAAFSRSLAWAPVVEKAPIDVFGSKVDYHTYLVLPPIPPERSYVFGATRNPERHTPDWQGYLAYLEDFAEPFFELLNKPIPVSLPGELQHSYVVGKTRSGKTELLKLLAHSSLSNALVIIDPHGDMAAQVARWPELAERLVYIDPSLASCPTINPFEAKGDKELLAQQLSEAIQSIVAEDRGGAFTINMKAILLPCIQVLFDTPGATLYDLQRFMDTGKHPNNGDLIKRGLEGRHASFFSNFSSSAYNVTKHAVYMKLQSLLNTQVFSKLTCGKSTLDLEALVEQRKVLVFNLALGTIGTEASGAFGRLVLAVLQSIALRRATQDVRTPLHIIVDECHNYITPSIETFLTGTAKFQVFLTLAQQNIGMRMSPELRDVVLNNTPVKFIGRTDDPAVKRISGQEHSNYPTGCFLVMRPPQPAFRLYAATHLLNYQHAISQDEWNARLRDQLECYYKTPEQPVPEPVIEEDAPDRPATEW